MKDLFDIELIITKLKYTKTVFFIQNYKKAIVTVILC